MVTLYLSLKTFKKKINLCVKCIELKISDFKKSIFEYLLRVETIVFSGINTKEIIIMKCPACKQFIAFYWLETECIEPN